MALTVLNNISSLTAENALANTQASLQKTLQQLSTGMKINSGSDDAAGLSIVSGMNANISALTQSQQNASNGIGLLQTADGALSQVTSLLNRAVTLATEGSTAGITANQSSALDTEYQSILLEIGQIGSATNYNGSNVFSSNSPTTFTSTQGTAAAPLSMSAKLLTTSALTAGTTTTVGAFSYTAKAGDKVSDLITALTTGAGLTALGAGGVASVNASGQLSVDNTAHSIVLTTNDAQLGSGSTATAGAATVSNNSVNGPVLTAGSITTIQDSGTGATFSFTAKANQSLTDLNNAIQDAVTSGTLSSGVTATISGGTGQLMITSNSSADSLKVASNDAAVGVMNAYNPSYVSSTAKLTSATVIAASSVFTINYANATSATYTTGAAATTLGDLINGINGVAGSSFTPSGAKAGTTAQLNASGQLEVDSTNGDITGASVTNTTTLGAMSAINGSSNSNTVYIGDGTTIAGNNTNITTQIAALSASALGLTGNLTSASTAQTSLNAITTAINAVSLQRGVIGASVNRLTAASGDMASQVTNLQSASNGLQNADIGKTVANMTQYNVLQSTGMAALQQSNQAQQAVLKLVQ
jgi:flagellin